MRLSSGQRLNHYSLTAILMPGKVIDRVHELACWNPAGDAIAFDWRDGTEIALMMKTTYMIKTMFPMTIPVQMITALTLITAVGKQEHDDAGNADNFYDYDAGGHVPL